MMTFDEWWATVHKGSIRLDDPERKLAAKAWAARNPEIAAACADRDARVRLAEAATIMRLRKAFDAEGLHGHYNLIQRLFPEAADASLLDQHDAETWDRALEEAARSCDTYKRREYGPHGMEWVSCEECDELAAELRALKKGTA